MASLCGTSLIFPLLQKSPFCISRMAGCLLLHLSCVCVFACVIMHIYVCVCGWTGKLDLWVRPGLPRPNTAAAAPALVRTVWCCAALSCGGVGKRSEWTSEKTEEEWGNCRQIGLMVVLREEVVGPTAAGHPSGPAWRARPDLCLVTYSPSGDEHSGTFHQSRVNKNMQ